MAVTGVKISSLPSAAVPLTGAELVPLVQGGVTSHAPASALNIPVPPPAPGPTSATAFILLPSGINNQSGATYTLQASDNGRFITLNNAAPITLTCPTGLGAAFGCTIMQIGLGQVAVVAGTGASVHGYNNLIHLAGPFAAALVFAYAPDTFALTGQTA